MVPKPSGCWTQSEIEKCPDSGGRGCPPNRATPWGCCRRPWPWLCHGADASAADPASLDLRFSKGPPRTPFQDHSKFTWVFEANPHATEGFLKRPLNPPKLHHEHGPFFWRSGRYRKTSNLRNGPPMMLMMLAPVACIISIIGAPFHKFGGIRLQPFCFFV